MQPSFPPREWFWQLQAEGHGPDWRFVAVFVPGDALAAAVRRSPPAGFVCSRRPDGRCGLHLQAHPHDSYLDAHNAAAPAGPQNRWVYHAVEVCGDELAVERGYGGYPGGGEGRAETDLLVALAMAPELSLGEWRILAGGDGYPWVAVAAGAGADALLAYLAGGLVVSVA